MNTIQFSKMSSPSLEVVKSRGWKRDYRTVLEQPGQTDAHYGLFKLEWRQLTCWKGPQSLNSLRAKKCVPRFKFGMWQETKQCYVFSIFSALYPKNNLGPGLLCHLVYYITWNTVRTLHCQWISIRKNIFFSEYNYLKYSLYQKGQQILKRMPSESDATRVKKKISIQ